jgi:hypothetical protein
MTDYEYADMELCNSDNEQYVGEGDKDVGKSRYSKRSKDRRTRRNEDDPGDDRGVKPRRLRSVVVSKQTPVNREGKRQQNDVDVDEEGFEKDGGRRERRNRERADSKRRHGMSNSSTVRTDRRPSSIGKHYSSRAAVKSEENDSSDEDFSESDYEGDEDVNGAVGGRRRISSRKGEMRSRSQRDRHREEPSKTRNRVQCISQKALNVRQTMKTRTFDGNAPWESFLIQFEICAEYNEWSD